MISGSQAKKIASRWWSERPAHLGFEIENGVTVYPVQKKTATGWRVELSVMRDGARIRLARVSLDKDGNIRTARFRAGKAA